MRHAKRPPPNVVTIRGSGDRLILVELAERQLRLADGLRADLKRGGLTPAAALEVEWRERRHRREHARLMAAVRAYDACEGSGQVEVDLNAEDVPA